MGRREQGELLGEESVCSENEDGLGGEEGGLVPGWLWGGEDPADAAMPVNHLKMTEERTVVRVYGLGRRLARVLEGLQYWTSSGTTLGMVRWAEESLLSSNMPSSFKTIMVYGHDDH